METLTTDTLDQAQKGEFTAFADSVRKVLDQKVKSHPYIKDKKEEINGFSRIKDIFAKIDQTYLVNPDDKTSEE
jgi:hypothetical protein